MNLKEYIDFYEKELEELEYKRQALLEIDKSTRYTDKKIEHYYDLIEILKNCTKSEELNERNIYLNRLLFDIEFKLKNIERAKLKNDKEELKKKTLELIDYLNELITENEE